MSNPSAPIGPDGILMASRGSKKEVRLRSLDVSLRGIGVLRYDWGRLGLAYQVLPDNLISRDPDVQRVAHRFLGRLGRGPRCGREASYYFTLEDLWDSIVI